MLGYRERDGDRADGYGDLVRNFDDFKNTIRIERPSDLYHWCWYDEAEPVIFDLAAVKLWRPPIVHQQVPRLNSRHSQRHKSAAQRAERFRKLIGKD